MIDIQSEIKGILSKIGEDPEREGLLKTPERVSKAYDFLTKGYRENPEEVVKKAIFNEQCNHMIIVKNIEFYSLCEHHMLPFYGQCFIGYISKNKIYGVSKLARVVECFSRRLQVQERLTQQVARLLKDSIDAEGVGVVMEAKHLCMMMRGVQKQNSVMVTSAMLGSFHDDPATRSEFLNLIREHKSI
ncbi:MAG: GTP cyclohydrolase I FolE [Fibrobacteres bacterium]|nr:GTP cyclohydrolase I FolE [Fibrobacterota bacterium]